MADETQLAVTFKEFNTRNEGLHGRIVDVWQMHHVPQDKMHFQLPTADNVKADDTRYDYIVTFVEWMAPKAVTAWVTFNGPRRKGER